MLATTTTSCSTTMSLNVDIFQVLIHIPLVPFTIRHANFVYFFQIFVHIRTVLSSFSFSAPSVVQSTMTSLRFTSTRSTGHFLNRLNIIIV
jgi:hypothetical protein